MNMQSQLPPSYPANYAGNYGPGAGYPAQGGMPPGMADEEGGSVNLGEYLGLVLANKWLILFLCALGTLVGVVEAYKAIPIYQADGLVQVEKDSSGFIGVDALEAVQGMGAQRSDIATEIELLKSRLILGQVVDKLRLDQIATPRYAPYLGQAIARHYSEDGVAKPWFNKGEYAWGGESIDLARIDVTTGWVGHGFLITAGEEGRFTVQTGAGEALGQGEVGQTFVAGLPGGGQVSLFVSRLKARPGTEFIARRIPRNAAIQSLAGRLQLRERGSGTGMLEMKLIGPNHVLLPRVLDEIMGVFLRQNVERQSAEAKSTLTFLDSQLPTLKAQLDSAEAAYNQFKSQAKQAGATDLDAGTQQLLQAMVSLEQKIAGKEQNLAVLRTRFTDAHPEIKDLEAELEVLRNQRFSVDTQVKALPENQQEILRLSRDVEVNGNLYMDLLNTAQQLRVAEAGTVGTVRIIDSAIYSGHIGPNKPRIVLMWFAGALALSLAIVVAKKFLRVTIDDPESIEKTLGISVLATVPHSKDEKRLSKAIKRGRGAAAILAELRPDADPVEAIRNLRTALHFALPKTPSGGHGALMISGPAQGIGKSFISRNLAWLLAEAGNSVVLIDADMRRGQVHRSFGLSRDVGLADYLVNPLPLSEVFKETRNPNLRVITCGTRPPNASELLMNPRFEKLIGNLSEHADYVIIDAPPVLAVSDAAIIGNRCGATLLVARAGQHHAQELEQTVKRLKTTGVDPVGFVLNDLDTTRVRYRYGYYGYHYQYSYKPLGDTPR